MIRNTNFTRSTLSALGALALGTVAFAGVGPGTNTVCFTDSIALQNTNWNGTVSIPQFNPALDENKDGAISFEEFRKSERMAKLTEDEQEDRFEALDRNHDMKLTLEDFSPPPAQ